MPDRIKPETVKIGPIGHQASLTIWKHVKQGDECEPFAGDNSIQVDGDFSAAVLTIEGSLNGRNFYPLFDNHGGLASWKAPGIKVLNGDIAMVCPRIEGGDETTDLTVTIYSGPAL